MSVVRKRIISLVLVFCFLVVLSIAVFAAPVYCAGGGGVDPLTHYWGILWLNNHPYSSYYHNVTRVYNGVVWKVSGHAAAGCDRPGDDFENYCPPGTYVGDAP